MANLGNVIKINEADYNELLSAYPGSTTIGGVSRTYDPNAMYLIETTSKKYAHYLTFQSVNYMNGNYSTGSQFWANFSFMLITDSSAEMTLDTLKTVLSSSPYVNKWIPATGKFRIYYYSDSTFGHYAIVQFYRPSASNLDNHITFQTIPLASSDTSSSSNSTTTTWNFTLDNISLNPTDIVVPL